MATETKARRTKKKAAPPSSLNVAYVLDMSGSMMSVTWHAREGTKNYLTDPKDGLWKQERDLIKKHGDGVYTRFSLTVFDTVFEQWIVDEPVLDVNLGTIERYQPRGNTALYDAVAHTITTLETRLQETGRSKEKCLVVVMTDGQENRSQEYGGVDGRKRFFDLIKAYEAKGNWTFVYLGADVDAYAESAAMGFAAGNTASYAKTQGSINRVSSSLGKMTSARRSSPVASSSSSFTDAGLTQDFTLGQDPGNVAQGPSGSGLRTPAKPQAKKRAAPKPKPDPRWDSSSASDAAKRAR